MPNETHLPSDIAVNNYVNSLQDICRFFDQIVNKYEFIYPNYLNEQRRIAIYLNQLFNKRQATKILDIACGNGTLLNALGELNHKYELFGTDISKKSISFARRHSRKANFAITYNIIDWMNLETLFPRKFDSVLCIGNSLSHIHQKYHKHIFKKIHCLLTKGGAFILDIYSDWQALFREKKFFQPRGYSRFSKEIVFCNFINEFNLNHIKRHVCFSYYLNQRFSDEPQRMEIYTICQFPMALSKLMKDLKFAGFKDIKELKDLKNHRGLIYLMAPKG